MVPLVSRPRDTPLPMSLHTTELAKVFMAATGKPTAEPADIERIEVALGHALASARSRYPKVEVSGADFSRYLGERLAETEADAGAIASRATDDLYLACACVRGDNDALSTLDSEVLSILPAAMAKLKLNSAAVEEATQRARTKLLVGKDGTGKLVDFSGTGDLRGWVKVIAIRDALRTARKEKREVSLSDELEAALPSKDIDPDLAYQRRLYGSEFKASFEAAVDELEARERSLLRQSIVFGATVDQIALVYQVHRATSARWIAKARENLGNKTRSHLRKALSINDQQFESIVRMIESQMDLSIERLLATQELDEGASED